MTRTRINIDVNERLLGWIDTTAKVLGATRTETARALLEYTRILEHSISQEAVKQLVSQAQQDVNQARSRTQTAFHQARRQSAPAPRQD